uniref:EGF-like domain-containing protein n=1 Tax=Strongyloides papillosus TaxID=174720 RepID=A0A0N5C2S3_STREA
MSKLLYLFLVWITSGCIEGQNNSFKLTFEILLNSGPGINGVAYGERQEANDTKIGDHIFNKQLILFKLPLLNYIGNSGYRIDIMLKFSHNGENIYEIMIPKISNVELELSPFDNCIRCNIESCEIGAVFSKVPFTPEPITGDFQNIDKIFYVVFEATKEHKYFVFANLPRISQKNILDVVPCPYERWISSHSISEYIVDKNNIIPFPNNNVSDKYYYYKISHYQKSDDEIFLKCGQIKQKNVPPIDVGYAFSNAEAETVRTYEGHNSFHYENMDLSIDSHNGLSHNKLGSLLNSSFISLHILLLENNINSTSVEIGKYNSDSKLYSGQTVFVLPLEWYNTSNDVVDDLNRKYPFRYDSQFLIPNIETTLRLKVNGVVQKFKTAKNSESMDTYTVDLGGINNGLVGCHAVPDNITHPGFKDFYEKRYRTELFVIDKNTNMSIKVNDTNSFVENSTYKCALYNGTTNYKNLTEKYIKETEFKIYIIKSNNLDGSNDLNGSNDSNKSTDSTKSKSTIWIIVGVSVGAVLIITLLLLAGLIFYKKRLLKKKGSKNSLSSRKSQPISKSSSVIENDFNVSMIQKKATNAGSKNIVKSKIVLNANPNMSDQNENRSKEISS